MCEYNKHKRLLSLRTNGRSQSQRSSTNNAISPENNLGFVVVPFHRIQKHITRGHSRHTMCIHSVLNLDERAIYCRVASCRLFPIKYLIMQDLTHSYPLIHDHLWVKSYLHLNGIRLDFGTS